MHTFMAHTATISNIRFHLRRNARSPVSNFPGREILTPLFQKGVVFFMQGKVEICGVNTAKLPVLKSAETRSLLEKARAGSDEARQALIAGNLRLVLSVIQKFSGRGESMDDLFQVGCIGLIKAVDCFDLSQNVQFSTYGVPAINGWRKASRRFSP